MLNSNNLSENISCQDTSEVALLSEEMDHEVNTTPTAAAEASLQNMALGEKEKHEKELATCSKLLDQVRGYFGFDRVTRSKAKETVTHSDLERALQCSNYVALKHAEAYGSVAVQRIETLQKEQVAPNAEAITVFEEKIKELEEDLKKLTSLVQANEDNIKTNVKDI